uniref:Uncharacterized protein n=1 Tax=Aegilops tauschii subsp. strangulata TaxID=200361 RepID=A0A453SXQ8_AEGTS
MLCIFNAILCFFNNGSPFLLKRGFPMNILAPLLTIDQKNVILCRLDLAHASSETCVEVSSTIVRNL